MTLAHSAVDWHLPKAEPDPSYLEPNSFSVDRHWCRVLLVDCRWRPESGILKQKKMILTMLEFDRAIHLKDICRVDSPHSDWNREQMGMVLDSAVVQRRLDGFLAWTRRHGRYAAPIRLRRNPWWLWSAVMWWRSRHRLRDDVLWYSEHYHPVFPLRVLILFIFIEWVSCVVVYHMPECGVCNQIEVCDDFQKIRVKRSVNKFVCRPISKINDLLITSINSSTH